MDDHAFFGNGDEEDEENEFVMCANRTCPPCIRLTDDHRGHFADSCNEDFFGLRELGIAAEFGMSSVTVPKALLKNRNRNPQNTQKSVQTF